ncbi:MAG: hypothetical protein RMY36_032480 [Nostoc sp. SerVER01]|nr:hypothetical protein [Nostoc sp. SerVER01]
MPRPQLNIKLDGEGEQELLESAKARAQNERISLKDFVLDALRMRLASKPKESTHAPQPIPFATKAQLDEFSRRLASVELALRAEIRKDREQIALLAGAIAQIEHRLDSTASPPIDEDRSTGDSQARQPISEAGVWGTWGSDAMEFLDTVQWSDIDG